MSRAAIIGTAGHIDHGKTLLIKLLTGVDTDRLKEEKKRGISIELGFASLTLPDGRRLGVVDVPGHERFIRNMLAGAGGIDLILFVIAADEGVMPQTREHMDILGLLGVTEGLVALTKVDLVDPDWLDLVTSEVRSYLDTTPLKGAPILPISSMTGEGRDALLAAIAAKLDDLEAQARGRFVRLPIDRVFVIEGFGTVVTGTLWSGRLSEGDRVRLQPAGRESRIKALEVHNQRVEVAEAGQRVAVCLHGVSRDSVERGDWVVLDERLRPVEKLGVRLRAVDGLEKPIAHRKRVRFYLGASERIGRLVLLDREELGSGEDGLAEIQLEGKAVAERGDHFVIRAFSPMVTLGGGRVLDISEVKRRRFRREDLDALKVAEEGTIEDRIAERVHTRGMLGLLEAELTQALGQPPAEIHQAVVALLGEGRLIAAGKSRLVTAERFREAGEALEQVIVEAERAQSLRYGPQKSEVKSRLEARIHPEVAEAWIQREIAASRLFTRGDRLRRSSAELALSPDAERLRAALLADLAARGLSGPSQKEFLEAWAREPLAAELLRLLLDAEVVVRLPGEILVGAAELEKVQPLLREYFRTHAEMTVANLKELCGVSRKQGVPILEHCDRMGWTHRRGDSRIAGSRLGQTEG